jgi:hypothetical protein
MGKMTVIISSSGIGGVLFFEDFMSLFYQVKPLIINYLI